MAQCQHPKEKRDGNLCTRCGNFVRERAPKTYHGTPSGYEKHKKWRKGEWSWPACDSCKAARTLALAEYNERPVVDERNRKRTFAKNRALWRLRNRYPADYAKFYAEELLMLEEGGSVIEQLQREIAILLRRDGQQSLKVAEHLLRQSVAGGWATIEEKERWARIRTIRARIDELSP